uniref:Uncharacterized protein n=2 Tax=Cacopsylla melanoneura TaxID=428564 RepID=A0A8D8QWL6_9HEMI
MLYINSKIVMVSRNTHLQFDRLYASFQLDRCVMEQKILDNYLTLALTSPAEFAYQYFGRPGFMAVARGEVIHISQCTPVIVTPRIDPTSCYNEFPVMWNNQSYFLTPRNRLLTDVASAVDCIPGLEPRYKLIDDKWYYMSQTGLSRINTPTAAGMTFDKFYFEEISNLANGGLYSTDMINNNDINIRKCYRIHQFCNLGTARPVH